MNKAGQTQNDALHEPVKCLFSTKIDPRELKSFHDVMLKGN